MFLTRAERARTERRQQLDYKPRRKRPNVRRLKAQGRGYKDLRVIRQWVTEVPHTPGGSHKTYRLVIRRQLIEERQGRKLAHYFRYRYVVTNLPASWTTEQVVDETYCRCDQENMIEQMGTGLAMWRMPTGQFVANSAWLEIARLAWNLAKWIALLALPKEVIRWEWKRFRNAFVYVPAQVVKHGRRVWLRLSHTHRYADTLVAAYQQLQT